jgi:hypothetical protein
MLTGIVSDKILWNLDSCTVYTDCDDKLNTENGPNRTESVGFTCPAMNESLISQSDLVLLVPDLNAP